MTIPIRDNLESSNPSTDEVERHLEIWTNTSIPFSRRILSYHWLEKIGISAPLPEGWSDEELPEKTPTGPTYSQGNPREKFNVYRAKTGHPDGVLQSREAERDLLAILARDASHVGVVREILVVEDMELAAHRVLFHSITDLNAAGTQPDRPHLTEALVQAGVPELIREQVLDAVLAAEPNPENLQSLAGIIRDKAFSRRTREALVDVLDEAASGRHTAAELASRVEATILSLVRIESLSEWEEPNLDKPTPPIAFPLEVFPKRLVELILPASETLSCSPDFLAVPCLTAAGAAIGATVALEIKKSWSERANLFTAIVGRPGAAKSPALAVATAPIVELQWELAFDFLLESDAKSNKRKKAMKLAKSKEERDAAQRKLKLEEDEENSRMTEINVSDTTCEAVSDLLANNPRGIIMVRDELAGWLNSLNQYKNGSGDDRDFYLSLWNGAPQKKNRVSQGPMPVHARRPFFAATGAITPSKLDRFTEDKNGRYVDDGFLDRMLLSYPSEVRFKWSWDDVTGDAVSDWSKAFRRLWNREMVVDDVMGGKAVHLPFDDAAKKAWESWITAHMNETYESDFPDHLVGPWSKFRTQCARLILILDQLRWAYDAKRGAKAGAVGVKSVESAIQLVDYFKAHFRRVVQIQAGNQDNPDARDVLDWAINRGSSRFSEREAKGNFRARIKESKSFLTHAVAWLIERHCIRPLPAPVKAVGRTAKAAYEINPHLLNSPSSNTQNTRNSQRGAG
ncbi:DnaB-like helicase N terminal domain-containing protein [Singulisphaera sp. GP187]|uniref:DUF3987 domain-containing protein n=1 Tax=Singulisphaera sp. GP187 TaxID=1882752 RepID=UPI00092CDE4F|nr:DUF3987 domain-containing protein [Singulisphaera sp. GP187]SIO60229.1 DnaB-like helicase N terminal domain-containing protein [Singulisphaera sp. GP187]